MASKNLSLQCLSAITILVAIGWFVDAGIAQQNPNAKKIIPSGPATVSGLVLPLGQGGRHFYLQNENVQVEVQLGESALVGMQVAKADFQQALQQRKLATPNADRTIQIPNELFVKVRFDTWDDSQNAIASKRLTNGVIHAGELPDHLPTQSELWFSGKLQRLDANNVSAAKFVQIAGQSFAVSTQRKDGAESILGLLKPSDIRPYLDQAVVYGMMKDNILHASEVLIEPIPADAVVLESNLPRYLIIGDSISSNYGKVIRDFHAGKISVHHPPTNCGSTFKGRRLIDSWLGDFRAKGKQWDVISFNFGHWDSSHSKLSYQENLGDIIEQLKQTDAKLVWVTTCPVPDGMGPIPSNVDDPNHAPGNKSGVVKSFLNPWAMEVIRRHPEITICDQWQFVYDHRDDLYKDWWAGDNIHFSAGPAYGIGRLLAEHVMERVGVYRGPGWKPPADDFNPSSPIKKNSPWQPAAYDEKAWNGDFYSEEEAAKHLPAHWKNAKRLESGFPRDFAVTLSATIPDHQGWTYDLVEPPNHLLLKSIKRDIQKANRLAWYPYPDAERRENLAVLNGNEFSSDLSSGADRYRFGPGLTGDELLSDLKSGAFPQDISLESFVDDCVRPNVSILYDLYRITRDRYYSDQIVKYAEGVQLILNDRKELADMDDATRVPAILWAHVNAARLLLEQVRVDRAGPSDPRVATAKRLLATANELLSPLVDGPFKSPFRSDQPFKPGPITKWLVENRKVSQRAAQILEYQEWRHTIVYLSVLTAAVRSMEEIQTIEGTDDEKDRITSYRRTIAVGLELLQRENDCVVSDGVPYFYHAHNARCDRGTEKMFGHPLLHGENSVGAGEIIWHLAYIWESGDTFGCPTALVAGYANAMVDRLAFPKGEKNGKIYPRSSLDSPWYIAASGSSDGWSVSERLGERFIFTAPFAAEILQYHRIWTPHKAINEDIQFLRAATLYREWKRRQKRTGN